MEQLIENVTQQIDALLRDKDFVVVAIDGKCTSGKTTLAARLAEIYDCNVFHMDDFFLRPEQRTPERFAQIGGEVTPKSWTSWKAHTAIIPISAIHTI